MRRPRHSTPWMVALVALCIGGPVLAASDAAVYRDILGLDSRTIVWVVAQLHLMFGAFVLGVPIFAVIVEFVGTRTGDARYDRLAHEFTGLLSAAFSTTAALGGALAFLLVGLYPSFMKELGGAMHQSFYVYAALFFAEAFTLYLYYYAWDRMQGRRHNAPRLRGPARVLTGLLAVAVVALMIFHGESGEEAREEGQLAARAIEDVAKAVEEEFRDDAEEGWLGAQTDEAAWPKRMTEALAELEPGRSEHEVAALAKAGPLVEATVVDVLENAPKNASADKMMSILHKRVGIAAADAKLAGENAASDLSASHWIVVGWCALALLLVFGVASWASSSKSFHLYLGVVLNLSGITLMMITNSWATFMMSPTGYNEVTSQFGGTIWGAIVNPLWQPLNLHRLLANVVLGGFVAGSYAAVRFLSAKSDEERAHYDWMGYIGNFVGILAMIPLPFAGYLLGREIYSYSPIMGNNMMGGAFSWGFIFQAVLIGMLFLGANYYLWIGMERIPGAERYRKLIPWYAVVLIFSFAVWVTPHNLPLSGVERAMMGGAQYHPILKYLGLMPAKNAVVNLIILTTFFCFLMYRRGNRGELRPFEEQGRGAKVVLLGCLASVLALLGWYAWTIIGLDLESISVAAENRWVLLWTAGTLGLEMVVAIVAVALTFVGRGKLGQAVYFATTAVLVAGFLGVWGFVTMVEANPFLRNIAVCQVLMVVSAMVLCGGIDLVLLRGAKVIGAIRWGKIPVRSQYALIVVTVAVVQLMGLMGFIRSALREDWHIYGVLRDTSAGAGTPSLAEMSWVVGWITLAYFLLLSFVFWLASLSGKHEGPKHGAQLDPSDAERAAA